MGSMHFQAAEQKDTSKGEDSGGDGKCHQGSAISNGLRREIPLFLRHRFASTQLTQDLSGVSHFFACRCRRASQEAVHEDKGESAEHQFSRPGQYRQITKKAHSVHSFVRRGAVTWQKNRRRITRGYAVLSGKVRLVGSFRRAVGFTSKVTGNRPRGPRPPTAAVGEPQDAARMGEASCWPAGVARAVATRTTAREALRRKAS